MIINQEEQVQIQINQLNERNDNLKELIEKDEWELYKEINEIQTEIEYNSKLIKLLMKEDL